MKRPVVIGIVGVGVLALAGAAGAYAYPQVTLEFQLLLAKTG